jgi:hypothetical protein
MTARTALVLIACALLAACQSAPKPAPSSGAVGVASSENAEAAWVRSEMYFAIAPADAEGLGLSAAEGSWRAFVDEEVTPRFPDGFTVLDAYGQWRESDTSPVERERSKVLVIFHADTPVKRAGVDALREAYKARTGEKSVLVVETPVRAPRF